MKRYTRIPLRAPLVAILSLLVGLLGLPAVTHAQSVPSFNIDACGALNFGQPDPVRSLLFEEWQSSDWEAATRTVHTYDSGNLVELLIQNRSNGAWQNKARTVQTFSDGLRATCTLQSWDDAASDWENGTRTTYDYDANDRVTERLQEVWDDGADAWQTASRTSLTYTDGNLNEELTELWTGSTWQNSTRITNTYDGSNRLTERLTETWVGTWQNSTKTTFTYENGDLTEELVETWNIFTMKWQNEALTTNTYTGENLTEQLEQTWDGIEWVNETLTMLTYDASDQLIETITQTWDGSDWANEDRSDLSYDGSSRLVRVVEQTWTSGGWENESRVTISYDQVLPVELVAFTVTGAEQGTLLAWRTASETNNAGFEVERSVEGTPFASIGFVEGHGTTSTPQAYRFTDDALPFTAEHVTYRLKQIDVDGAFAYSPAVELDRGAPSQLALHPNFPNPVRDQTTIRYELPRPGTVQLNVFDVMGRRVAQLVSGPQQGGRNETTFRADRLPSGVYFIRLHVDGQSLSRQMTVVR